MEFGLADILQLSGALGLFLFGMKVMSDALLLLAGNKMRHILATMTSNRFLGIATGFLITSVIQSSSATTLMVVSFSNASLLTLSESISVIMGANIGTTITAWLITILGFKVSMSSIALPLVGFGFLFMFSKKPHMKNWGGFIIGFAILFIGLQFLKEAMPDINENPGILEFLNRYTAMGYGSILLFLLIGTLLTIIVQSSSATMALTLIMTAEGWIPFELAAAMVLGENIGTTITANLAAIVANFKAKRTARAHLIFNLLGILWMLLLFYPFLRMISWVTIHLGSQSPYISAAAIPVAISLFHTFFNLLNTFLLVWFIKPIARLVERIVPERIAPEKEIDQPKFLNKKLSRYPETVIALLVQESRHLYLHTIFKIVAHAMNIHTKDIISKEKPEGIIEKSREKFGIDVRELYLSKVKTIYGEIIAYATNAQSTLKLTAAQNNRILEIKVANRKMVEIIKDMGELNRNVSKYMDAENTYIKQEYDRFRKKMVKALRVIYQLSTEQMTDSYYQKLQELRLESKKQLKKGPDLKTLITENKITTDMASSLVNDHDHLHEVIKKLIDVAQLLYSTKDPLLEVDKQEQTSLSAA